MKLWDIFGDCRFWKVQLDVRDLGRRLDFTNRARAGTLSCRVRKLLLVLLLLVPCLLVFRLSWGWFVLNIILLASMQLRPPMCLLHRLVPLGQLLLGRSGLVRFLWLKLLHFFIYLTGLWC